MAAVNNKNKCNATGNSEKVVHPCYIRNLQDEVCNLTSLTVLKPKRSAAVRIANNHNQPGVLLYDSVT